MSEVIWGKKKNLYIFDVTANLMLNFTIELNKFRILGLEETLEVIYLTSAQHKNPH